MGRRRERYKGDGWKRRQEVHVHGGEVKREEVTARKKTCARHPLMSLVRIW